MDSILIQRPKSPVTNCSAPPAAESTDVETVELAKVPQLLLAAADRCPPAGDRRRVPVYVSGFFAHHAAAQAHSNLDYAFESLAASPDRRFYCRKNRYDDTNHTPCGLVVPIYRDSHPASA